MNKKKRKFKKGFTLIELLAIIVILAAIALITVPIILNVIENSKKGAAIDSAYGYKEAVQKYYATQLSLNSGFQLNGDYSIITDGALSDDEDTYDILMSGTIPNSGYLTIDKGTVTSGCIQINEYAVRLEDRKVTQATKGYCIEPPVIVEEFPQVTDENPGIVCGNGQTEDYDNSSVCYIYSVEDLVAFSAMVNSGKNFSSKTVMLMNNLDIENDKSYANLNANQFNDLNENGTTSTTLKEELTDTNAKGFKSIGNSSNKFSGLFQGNTKIIKNLFINRNNTNYTGLFGCNEGTIKGLKVIDANVSGYQYSSLVVGYNTGSVTSIIATGTLNGYSTLGLASGYSDGTVEAAVKGDINSTYNSSGSYPGIGGLVGVQSNGTIKGINLGGTISVTAGNTYRNIGSTGGSPIKRTLASNTTTSTASSNSITDLGGATVDGTHASNIASIERVLDSYVAGDNNNDGYYYDNDGNGNITIYSLSEKPLDITMSGSGTSEDPYLIKNYNQLKEASYDTSKVYRLEKDINMHGKNPILLASVANPFTGTFDGNGYTISNLTLSSYDYVGLFGKNSSTGKIRGLNTENINILSHDNAGIICGYNNGSITDVIAKGTVTGYTNLGLAAGYSDGTIEAAVLGDVTSSYNSTGMSASVGGIVGAQSNGTIKGVNLGGTISVTAGNAYRTIGSTGGTPTRQTLSSNTTTSPASSNSISGLGGATVNEAYINNIASIERVLDSYVAGDNNNDGNYFGNDENGNIKVYSKLRNPLTITMQGSGTSEDPYLITSYDQLKEASYNQSKAYRLETDINFQGKNAIMLSSYSNPFTGIFNGNGHTISNLTLGGYNYVGLFGYNETAGKVRGLNTENINIASYEKSGIICGENKGDITDVIAKGTLTGYQYLGLAAGYNYGKVEAAVLGNITSSYNSSGGYPGVGGIVGTQSNGTVKGINLGGTISVTAGNAYRNIGTYGGNPIKQTLASSTVTAPAASKTFSGEGGATVNASYINNIATIERVLDSYVAGDNNNDGNYFGNDENGNIKVYSKLNNPLTVTMAGTGTSEDPYLIKNYNQLKEAAYDPSKAYRLDINIDFQGKNPIVLSSYNNKFTGIFDGNEHTISNLTLGGYDYTGLFGYNATGGVIKGLTVNNATVVSDNRSGILCGENQGSITYVIVNNGTLSGYQYLGLAAGYNYGTILAVVSGDISSTYNSSGGYPGIGGIVGTQSNGTIKGIMHNGTITLQAGNAFRAIGSYGGSPVKKLGALNTVTINGSTKSNTSLSSENGKNYTASELQTLTPYQEVELNTSSTSGEYRYALDSNYNPYIVKN